MEQTGLFPEGVEMPSVSSAIKYVEYTGLKNFRCRAVVVGDTQSGEYHVKPLGKFGSAQIKTVLRGIVECSDMGVINDLNLEFPIFMKVDSILANEAIEESLKQADEYLSKQG